MYKALTVFVLSILIILASIGPIMSRVEHQNYNVVSSNQSIEIRSYYSNIIAEVEVQGERKQALSKGFKVLASYIFGDNQSQAKIAMTAPVQQQYLNDRWSVSFIMPIKYTLKNLPKPISHQVNIKKVPAKTFIVIRFSGRNNRENLANHEKKLTQHMKEHHLKSLSPAKYAFYHPPWTLPFMRRNEIMFEINITD